MNKTKMLICQHYVSPEGTELLKRIWREVMSELHRRSKKACAPEKVRWSCVQMECREILHRSIGRQSAGEEV